MAASLQSKGVGVSEACKDAFRKELEDELTARYGPMVSGNDLRLVLGYPSQSAFRQALIRKTLPVSVFSVEHRRGKFAFVRDVAEWLAKQRQQMCVSDKEDKEMK